MEQIIFGLRMYKIVLFSMSILIKAWIDLASRKYERSGGRDPLRVVALL